jgi:HSP20 family protein
MAENKNEMVAQEKKELVNEKEHTIPGKRYIPATDIVETDNELLVYMDMPGVPKENLKINLEKNILAVDGKIDDKPYADIEPVYAEYNVGHYTRSFELSNKIDQDNIKAHIEAGVLTLTLPMVPESQPKTIEIN